MEISITRLPGNCAMTRPLRYAICVMCGDLFGKSAKRVTMKFCSNTCRRSGRHWPKLGLTPARGTCERCGKDFAKPPRGTAYRFCSRDCATRGKSGPTRHNKTTLQCAFCFRPYERSPADALKSKFCSARCYAEFQKRAQFGDKNSNFKNAGWKICEACGEQFKSYTANRRYCGQSCSHPSAASEAMRNAIRGREAEDWCFTRLANAGYQVAESPGSRGPFDLLAIHDDHPEIAVQVKRTKNITRRWYGAELRKMQACALEDETILKQLWCWVDDHGWFVVHLENNGERRGQWLDE